MNKVFLEDLPRRGAFINWKKSIGCKIKFIYNDVEGELEIIDYDTKNKYLHIKYLDKNDYKITTGNFQKCQLGKLLDFYSSKFKIKIGQTFKDIKRDLVITERKHITDRKGCNRKWYKYTCNKCGWTEGWIVESDLLKGAGCSCCNTAPKIVVEGINDIPVTAPWMVKYFQGGYDEAKLYTKNSNKKIIPICPDCGKIKEKSICINTIYEKHSISCACRDGNSFPNKIAYNLLYQLGIDFTTEYCPDWISPKKYDFYFNIYNKKYIIEMDGEWHCKDNNMSGQTKEESKEIDDYKDNMADRHGIEVIRIDSKKSELEFIKDNILNSVLAELFDLSCIDWLKIHEYALSNLIKIASDYKKLNPNMSAHNIGDIMGLHEETIRRYWKQGMELGWCKYIPKDFKKVEIFKDSNSLGIFNSRAEIEKQSLKLFGIKLFGSAITKVCLNKQKEHKGYTFSYTKE